MNIGDKIYKLRKEKGITQEEVAEICNVSRQTISKWETNQSVPEVDKIEPLCKLYEISADELLLGKKKEAIDINNDNDVIKLRAKGIGKGVLIYFIAIAFVTVAIPFMKMDPVLASAIFLVMCGIATYIIIYTVMVYKTKKEENNKVKKSRKIVYDLVSIIFVFIYLLVSFITGAWYITWIIWIVYIIVINIIKLLFVLGDSKNEE